jgi:hypothetical protein
VFHIARAPFLQKQSPKNLTTSTPLRSLLQHLSSAAETRHGDNEQATGPLEEAHSDTVLGYSDMSYAVYHRCIQFGDQASRK